MSKGSGVMTPSAAVAALTAQVASAEGAATTEEVAPSVATALAAGVAPGAVVGALLAVGVEPGLAGALAAEVGPAVAAALEDVGQEVSRKTDETVQGRVTAMTAVQAAAASVTYSDEITLSVGKEGRITLPARVRELLGLKEGTQVVLDVDLKQGWIRVRPAVTVPRQHSWMYTSNHLAQVARALADVAQGRVSRASEHEVTELLAGRESPDKGRDKVE